MKVNAKEFMRHLHEKFLIYTDDSSPIDAELIEVTGLTEPFNDEDDEWDPSAFSLVFRVPPQLMLTQRIYTVEHEQVGSMDIFLVPITPDGEGGRLEAVFNLGPI